MVRTGIVAAVAAALLNLVVCGPACAFEYSGDEGPAFWHELDPMFAPCGSGMRQSPIDIRGAVSGDTALKPLLLDLHDTEIHLENNGHTIEQEYEPGSVLVHEGITYQLRQFHFHTLSEHTLSGTHLPMEMHAVFRDPVSGNLAVIGQLFRIGAQNDFLALFDMHLPERAHDVFGSEEHINLADGLRNTAAYYTYPGSLTTPPCSPIVTWIVLREVASISPEQFRVFHAIMGNNFRPVQELGEREVRRPSPGRDDVRVIRRGRIGLAD